MTRQTRIPLVLAAVSFLLWGGWVVLRTPGHPNNDLSNGHFSDHVAHMAVTRSFWTAGADIWRFPAAKLYRSLTRAEIDKLPADVRRDAGPEHRFMPGWPADKPFNQGWSKKPRMYPPGFMVAAGPAALLYHYTDLSFSGACRLLILTFLLFAHVSLFFVFERCLAIEDGKRVLWFLPLFILYSEIIHWTLEGFYDAMAIAPLLLCARFLDERRGLAAVIAFCAATTIHFRALFFSPWVLYAVWIIVRDRQWQGWGRRHLVGIGAAALLAVATLYPFSLLWPVLKDLKSNNPLGIGLPVVNVAAVAAFLVLIAACAGALAWSRAWVDVAVLAWITVFVLTVREAYSWHILLALPWLAAPALGAVPSRAGTARNARLAALLSVAVMVYKNTLVPLWLARVFS